MKQVIVGLVLLLSLVGCSGFEESVRGDSSASSYIIALHGGNWENRGNIPFDYIENSGFDYVLLNYADNVTETLLSIHEEVIYASEIYDRIYLCGTSYGGTLSLFYGLFEQDRIAGIVALGSPLDILPAGDLTIPVCLVYNTEDAIVDYGENADRVLDENWENATFHTIIDGIGHSFFNLAGVTDIILDFFGSED